jgi:hypothetical protein
MAKIGPPPKRSTKGAPPVASAPKTANLERPEPGKLKPLNFKVPADFHREFKSYAATRAMSMLDVLREGFRLMKEHHGS